MNKQRSTLFGCWTNKKLLLALLLCESLQENNHGLLECSCGLLASKHSPLNKPHSSNNTLGFRPVFRSSCAEACSSQERASNTLHALLRSFSKHHAVGLSSSKTLDTQRSLQMETCQLELEKEEQTDTLSSPQPARFFEHWASKHAADSCSVKACSKAREQPVW